MIGTSGLSVLFAVLLVVLVVPDSFTGSEATNISSGTSIGGVFTLTHLDSEGNVIEIQKVHNEVTNEGMECVADLIFNGTASCTGERTFSYLSVGTDNTAVDETDTALNAEDADCARAGDATVALDTGTTNQRTATISGTFSGANCEGSGYQEVGVFDTSVLTQGNMLARATFASITLSSGDTLQVDYDIVINNS